MTREGHETESRYRQIVELAPYGILIGRASCFEYANPAALKLLGAGSLAALTGRSPSDLVRDERSNLAERFAALNEANPSLITEGRLVRLDGTTLDIELTATAFEDEKGRGFQIVVRNVSERTRTEAALRESEERLRLAFAGAQEGVWDWDLETGQVVYSTQWKRMLGYGDDEIEPNVSAWERLLHPDDRVRAAKVLEGVNRGEAEYAAEFRLRHRDGHYVDVLSRGFAVRRGAGEPVVRIVGTHFDLSERKRTEAQLKADRRQLRAFLENSAVIGWLKDEEGRIRFLSENFQKRFRVKAADWLGKTDHSVWPHPNAELFRRNDLEVIASGVSAEFAEEVPNPDGTSSWWLCNKFPFEDADGNRYVGGLGVDITDRVHAEEMLRRAHEELERRVEERTRELATVNASLRHENVERERAERARRELLARLVFAQEDERRRIARDMHDQFGEQLTALGLQIRGLKAVVAGNDGLSAHVNDLERVAQRLDRDVDHLVWALRPTALDDLGLRAALANYVKDWSTRVGVSAELHTTGLVDERLSPNIETSLYRIAQEALTNIAKHAKASRVEVLLERQSAFISLIVEDDGVGFEGGVPRDASGFGLLGMQERAALVGATLDIESTAGSGTTIIVRIATPTEGQL